MKDLTKQERSKIALEEFTEAHNSLAETTPEGVDGANISRALFQSENYKEMIMNILYNNMI